MKRPQHPTRVTYMAFICLKLRALWVQAATLSAVHTWQQTSLGTASVSKRNLQQICLCVVSLPYTQSAADTLVHYKDQQAQCAAEPNRLQLLPQV